MKTHGTIFEQKENDEEDDAREETMYQKQQFEKATLV